MTHPDTFCEHQEHTLAKLVCRWGFSMALYRSMKFLRPAELVQYAPRRSFRKRQRAIDLAAAVGRPGKSGFCAHLSTFFLGLRPPNSSIFWNGLLGPPGFIRFPVTASKNGNKIGKNPIFLLGSARAVRTAPAIERSC